MSNKQLECANCGFIDDDRFFPRGRARFNDDAWGQSIVIYSQATWCPDCGSEDVADAEKVNELEVDEFSHLESIPEAWQRSSDIVWLLEVTIGITIIVLTIVAYGAT